MQSGHGDLDPQVWKGTFTGKHRDGMGHVAKNDVPKDECRVNLEGPEKEWWTDTELGLLRPYQFPGHVTSSDGSVGTG